MGGEVIKISNFGDKPKYFLLGGHFCWYASMKTRQINTFFSKAVWRLSPMFGIAPFPNKSRLEPIIGPKRSEVIASWRLLNCTFSPSPIVTPRYH